MSINNTIEKVTQSFEEFTYAKSRDELELFFWSKFTDYYLEFIKYRIFGDDQISKKAACQTFSAVFSAILKMYAPIIPFITEEIYHQIFVNQEEKSIHLLFWPQPIKLNSAIDIFDFEDAVNAISEIRKYKSEQNLSLGIEIGEYNLKSKVDLEKYGEFIQKVMRIKKIIN